MDGYIKLFRGLLENDLWLSESFTKAQAWVDILLLTNYKSSYLKYRNGEMVKINRGECGYSMETLSKRWRWSRNKVKRFFDFLESQKMIQQKIGSKSTIIKVINFGLYQERTSNGHQTDTNKERKERKEYSNISLSINSKRIGKREREILKDYCKRKKITNDNAYIRKLIDNGDAELIIKEEKIRLKKLEQREKETVREIDKSENPADVQAAYLAAKSKITEMIKQRYKQ